VVEVLGWWLPVIGVADAVSGPIAEGPPQIELWHLLLGSGWIVRLVLLTLVGCSIGSWGIAVAKEREMRLANDQTARFTDVFWDAKNLAAIQAASSDLRDSPVAQVFRAGHQELLRYTRARRGGEEESVFGGGVENVQRAMLRARTEEVTRLERGLTFLATTSSTAPFIGLFGTVWGIMTSFQEIGARGSASLAVVAPGISEALVATAAGLAVAIPAVVFYNYFSTQLADMEHDMQSFSADFLNLVGRDLLAKQR
jgi:biopolymer transport protein TolQ